MQDPGKKVRIVLLLDLRRDGVDRLGIVVLMKEETVYYLNRSGWLLGRFRGGSL